jgi:hypothetical protein
MDIANYVRNGEQSIYDFNTPWSMAIVVLGFLCAWAVTSLLEHLGVTRHVWHLPLFFAALAVAHRLDVIADDLEACRNQTMSLPLDRYWDDYSL